MRRWRSLMAGGARGGAIGTLHPLATPEPRATRMARGVLAYARQRVGSPRTSGGYRTDSLRHGAASVRFVTLGDSAVAPDASHQTVMSKAGCDGHHETRRTDMRLTMRGIRRTPSPAGRNSPARQLAVWRWTGAALLLLAPPTRLAAQRPASTGEPWQIVSMPQSSQVLARDGSLVGEIGRQWRTIVPIAAALRPAGLRGRGRPALLPA